MVMSRLDSEKPKAWCILGKYYLGQKELKQSLMPLKKCSSIDPTTENRLNYGIALFDYGNVDIARSMCVWIDFIHN